MFYYYNMVKCNICKKKQNINLKGNMLNTFLCNKCKNEFKSFASNLKQIQKNQDFLKHNNNIIKQEQQQQNNHELKQIAFNCWIIQERQQHKKFIEQQTNKNFLIEQYKQDLNQEMQEDLIYN